MGNTNLKLQKNRQNLTKNGGLSRKQTERNNVTSYPNYLYPQQELDRWIPSPSFNNQYPQYYYNPEILNQTKNAFPYSYEYPFTQNVNVSPPSISSYGGYYVDKPYYETPIAASENTKYAVRGSKKQEVRDSPKNENQQQQVNFPNNYRNSTFYQPYYQPYTGQGYFNYYPSFYSYYSGYYQPPYSQIYMNFAQSTYAPSPKIKVKDYIIPLPVEKQSSEESSSNQIDTSNSFRKKSKKVVKQSEVESSEHDSLK